MIKDKDLHYVICFQISKYNCGLVSGFSACVKAYPALASRDLDKSVVIVLFHINYWNRSHIKNNFRRVKAIIVCKIQS